MSIFAALSALYLLAAWSIAFALLGVIRGSNPLLLYLAALAGAGVLWLASIGALVLAIRAAIRRDFSHCAAFVVTVGLTFASPLVARATLPFVIRRAESRDLQRVGIASLRAEAGSLVTANKAKKNPFRWFGGEVPPGDLPPAIRKLSARAAYVTAADEGVVFVTDGLASWRGGYLITPTGSAFVPVGSRQIIDGVYYVTAR